MGQHIDTRNTPRRNIKEHDESARRNRATFKQYLRQVEEELLDGVEDVEKTYLVTMFNRITEEQVDHEVQAVTEAEATTFAEVEYGAEGFDVINVQAV